MSKQHDIFENRTQFQLERMILFSDAVFAIAITLLVIEIKIPKLDSETALWEDLKHTWYEFFGVALSFAVIGQFWTTHHKIFGYVINFDNKLLWLNLHLLFWIILMPFSTGINSKYGNLNSVWTFYCCNMFMIGLSVYFIWRYILNPARKLSTISGDPAIRKTALTRSFLIAIVFLMGAVIALFPGMFATMLSRMVFALIYPAVAISKRIGRKKITPLNEQG